MVQIPKFDFQPYLEIAKRRWIWIVIPFILCILGGFSYTALTPKMYRAKTVILVEEQSVPKSYVNSPVTENLRKQIRTINQQVNSRTNLEKIIKEFNLFSRKKKAKQDKPINRLKDWLKDFLGMDSSKAGDNNSLSMYSLVQDVKKKINVRLKSGNQAFEISFEWRDPEVAAKVANALASKYIEQHLQYRQEVTMGTTSFLDAEAERLRKRLEKKEEQLEEFKKKHMGMLPSQLDTNNNILSQLRQELNNLEERLSQEKQKAMVLREQLNNLDTDRSYFNASSGEEGELSEKELELQKLSDKLADLKSKYTENHPDVVQIQKRINSLKQEIGKQNQEQEGDAKGKKARRSTKKTKLEKELRRAEANISKYEDKIDKLKSEIQKYRHRVEQTSSVSMELKNLERNYKTVRKRYNEILNKKLNAQMAGELENKQKGEKFRVIDSAVPPSIPYKPDVQKLLMLSLIMGLGLGGGAAYLRETLDPAFYTPEEVEEYLDTEVIVSLPMDKNDKKKD